MKQNIIIIGANGQLGKCVESIAPQFEDQFEFVYTTYDNLDITNYSQVEEWFESVKPVYCINASAYTAVDLAETEREKAFKVNATGVAHLAKACFKTGATLIHVSTDYVFDGETDLTYSEDDLTSPINVYGESKRKGEELALEVNPHTIIIRTSWLYSEFNNNFVKTMLRLFSDRDELNIVADQFGQPTYAGDLAEAIMKIIVHKDKKFGIYHFSNQPETTWFVFAQKIAELSGSKIKLNPIETKDYPTPAKRPHRSTMSLDKIEADYRIELKDWEESLEKCLQILLQK